MESLKAAVASGADAVYLGAKQYSARASAGNFTMEELSEAMDYCHLRGVKVYLTVNTLYKDNERQGLLQLVNSVYAMGVDVTEQIPQDLYSRLLCSSEKGSMHWHYLEAAGNFLRGRGLNPAGLFVDVMAVAWACDESMAKFAEGKVLVERFGEVSSGRTVFDQSGNINNKSRLFAAYEYDFEKLRKLLIERVFK